MKSSEVSVSYVNGNLNLVVSKPGTQPIQIIVTDLEESEEYYAVDAIWISCPILKETSERPKIYISI